jgi:phosphopantetheinyl transferase (holo-ACP synthase)
MREPGPTSRAIGSEKTRQTIRLTGRAEQMLAGRKVHLSISHLLDYATAIVVIED